MSADHPPAETKPLNPFLRAFIRWTLICGVSAVPSFYFGLALGAEVPQVLGMVCGILAFVLAYSAAECSFAYRRIIQWRHARSTLRVGYATRIFVSIVFPLGAGVDVGLGVFSVNLVMGGVSAPGSGHFFLTTLVQGVLMNAVLFVYMLLVWVVTWAVASLVRTVRRWRAPAAP